MDGLAALVRMNFRRQLRGRRWFLAVLLFAALFIPGVVWASDKYDLFGDALVVAFIVAINFGIAQDRRSGFDALLDNFVSPGTTAFSRLVVTLTLYVSLVLIAFLLAAVAWRDPGMALWHSTYMFLILGLALLLSFLLELVFGTELPGVLSLLLCTLFLMSFIMSAPEGDMSGRTEFLGLNSVPGDFRTMERLLLVDIVWNTAVVVVAVAVWKYQNRRKRVRPPA